jgi:hypothetical protein
MKKLLISSIALLGVLTACDPSKDDISAPSFDINEQEFSDGFSFKQYSDAECTVEAADGNYIKYATNPEKLVTIYTLSSDGTQSVLSKKASSGVFKLAPKRGSSPAQTFYARTYNWDGSYLELSRDVNVYVATELTPEVRLLASDAYGKKIWKWDTESYGGRVWGNMGNTPTTGEDFATTGNGIWWGTSPEGIAVDQLQHSDTGQAIGEESENAYMEFTEDGDIVVYDGSGNKLTTRGGKYSVSDYDGKYHASENGAVEEWTLGTLNTSAGAILFPFQINTGGKMPTEFQIIQLDANHLKLVYANPGYGAWDNEGALSTWWAFKSVSDAEASLTGFGTKEWTWDTEYNNGIVWGDMGYYTSDIDGFINNASGLWWGTTPEGLTDQLQHSDTGVAIGEESADAYMTFDWKTSTVKTYDASGTEIRSGKFEISEWDLGRRTFASNDADNSSDSYTLGTLSTDAGSILFPFMINGEGYQPTDFQIMQLDEDHLKLIYTAAGRASWEEATWWAFKAKK